MKRILLFLTMLVLILSLAACGSSNDGKDNVNAAQPGIAQSDNENDSAEEPAENSGGKTLVVYFSATGNTKEVAAYIASATAGDLFELVPEEPYSSEDMNWNDENSRVVYEHEHPEERNVALVSTSVDNFAEYDTVFIGYPIWWGIAAWPVDGFIRENDFSGKTVIPFCTSSSSSLGESGELLRKAAGSGNWLEGVRFPSGAEQKDVEEWVASLKL